MRIRQDMHTEFYSGNLKGRYCLKDLSVGRRMTLNVSQGSGVLEFVFN
jgi:hypothetical protein